jgi:hypothetical protein
MGLARTYNARPLKAKNIFTTMLRRLILAFSDFNPRVPREGKLNAVREIVRAHSHGNIRLQWGQYYTKKDLDAKFARLRGSRFAS